MKKSASSVQHEVRSATEGSATAPHGSAAVEINERGFLVDLARWTPEVAEHLARHQGLPRELDGLTPDHWRVIDFMRSHYQRTGATASVREICDSLVMTKKQFLSLFPSGALMARRMAGLPGPRRSANGSLPSPSQQLHTRNWWERLTR